MPERTSDIHTQQTTSKETTVTEDEFIKLDLYLDELAYASGQGRRPLDNIKHETFCREYLIDFNGQRAAIAAGYANNSARQTAYKLLTTDYVADRIRYMYRKRQMRTDLKADNVIRELQKLAFSDIMDYVKIDARGNMVFKASHEMENTEAICEIEIQSGGKVKKKRIKLHDKIRPLEKLMQHLGIDNPVELIIKMKKLEMDMQRTGAGTTTTEDDGFMGAMNDGAEDILAEFAKLTGGDAGDNN